MVAKMKWATKASTEKHPRTYDSIGVLLVALRYRIKRSRAPSRALASFKDKTKATVNQF